MAANSGDLDEYGKPLISLVFFNPTNPFATSDKSGGPPVLLTGSDFGADFGADFNDPSRAAKSDDFGGPPTLPGGGGGGGGPPMLGGADGSADGNGGGGGGPPMPGGGGGDIANVSADGADGVNDTTGRGCCFNLVIGPGFEYNNLGSRIYTCNIFSIRKPDLPADDSNRITSYPDRSRACMSAPTVSKSANTHGMFSDADSNSGVDPVPCSGSLISIPNLINLIMIFSYFSFSA